MSDFIGCCFWEINECWNYLRKLEFFVRLIVLWPLKRAFSDLRIKMTSVDITIDIFRISEVVYRSNFHIKRGVPFENLVKKYFLI